MKLLILTNNTTKKQWEPTLKEVAPFLKTLREENAVEVRPVSFDNVPRELYFTDANGTEFWGVNRNWLRSMSQSFGQGYDMFMWHDPNFQVQGAWGFFNRSLSTDTLAVKQVFRPLTARNARYKEFTLDVARTVVHEVLHAKAFKHGIPDETHDYQAQDNLMAYCEKIRDYRTDNLNAKIIYLQRHVVALLKRLVAAYGGNPEPACSHRPTVILHHSATARDYTRKATILKALDGSGKGFDFYNWIILPSETIEHRTEPHKRGTMELCVVGDFQHEKPTDYQILRIKELTKGCEVLTHHEAGERGIASQSECPGKLNEFITL